MFLFYLPWRQVNDIRPITTWMPKPMSDMRCKSKCSIAAVSWSNANALLLRSINRQGVGHTYPRELTRRLTSRNNSEYIFLGLIFITTVLFLYRGCTGDSWISGKSCLKKVANIHLEIFVGSDYNLTLSRPWVQLPFTVKTRIVDSQQRI